MSRKSSESSGVSKVNFNGFSLGMSESSFQKQARESRMAMDKNENGGIIIYSFKKQKLAGADCPIARAYFIDDSGTSRLQRFELGLDANAPFSGVAALLQRTYGPLKRKNPVMHYFGKFQVHQNA